MYIQYNKKTARAWVLVNKRADAHAHLAVLCIADLSLHSCQMHAYVRIAPDYFEILKRVIMGEL